MSPIKLLFSSKMLYEMEFFLEKECSYMDTIIFTATFLLQNDVSIHLIFIRCVSWTIICIIM
jgi:hypothetical protein